MRARKWLMVVAAAACLTACNPRDRAMPDLYDAQATARAVKTLSPRKDGSQPRSSDGQSAADVDSDQATFARWYLRWANDEDAHRLNSEMPSLPVPATIGEAIDQQRADERTERAAAAARNAKAEAKAAQDAADQIEIDADAEANREAAAREQAAKDAQAAAQAAEQQRRDAALEAEQTAAKDAAYQMSLAEARQSKLNYECRMKRQQAASASIEGKSDVAPGTYQRVWDSFHCRAD